MAKLLTKKRAAWAEQFKPKVLRGTPIKTNAGVSAWYAEQLVKLADEMHRETLAGISRLFKAEGQTHGYSQDATASRAAERGRVPLPKGFSEDASLASQARILLNRLKREIGSLFEKKALDLAWGMLNRSNKANAASVHQSLKELSGGLSIKTNFISGKLKESLKASVAENVSYISSIRSEYHTKIEGAVMRSITSGNGLADLVPELEKIGGVSRTRAHFIALDQTRKANKTLTRQRLLDAGVTHFRWIHTGRSKVPRPLHRDVLNGRIYPFDKPPVIDAGGQRGFPGDLPNCTCDMEPVVLFDEGEEAAT